jgi:hypothetical protein
MNHGHIKVPMNLLKGSDFMNEETSLTIGTEVLLMELFAVFGLVFIILGGIFKH